MAGRKVRWPAWILSAFLALVGIVLLGGGIWLVALGGTAWYVVAGLFCLFVAFLCARGDSRASLVYAGFLLITLGWALSVDGLRFWRLLPPLAGPAAIGLLFALPVFWSHHAAKRWLIWTAPIAAVLCLVVLGVAYSRDDFIPRAASASTFAQAESSPDAWSAYGRTMAGTRYSPDTQITPANVASLERAWSFSTGDTSAKLPKVKSWFSFMATPLMIDDRVVFCSPLGKVFALDADSGKMIWRFDPKADPANAQMLNCRGVSYHASTSSSNTAGTNSAAQCEKRIISTTLDGRLVALDFQTGQPCAGFGTDGQVSLRRQIGPVDPFTSYTTSPAAIVGDVAILGSYVRDNYTNDEPSGVIRGFDVRTGEMLWAWDPGHAPDAGPPGENHTWTRGSPNAWSVFSADPQLGLVYLPMGNATPDHVGTHRTERDERYSSAVVALDVRTGRERWTFQTVHHDIWDYDVPAQPSLFDFPVGGGTVPAIAVPTKRGDIFVLDRRDGTPLLPIEERSVPSGTIPGEKYAATQPYQAGFPTLRPDRLKESDMWGATPLDRLWCRIRYRSLDYDGAFTPPSERGMLQYPGIFGALNWGGVSIDEGRELLIVNSSAMPQEVKLYRRGQNAGAAAQGMHAAGTLPQEGTDYAVSLLPMLSPLGVPCQAPPWGFLTAIDLKSRSIAWQRPLGTSRDVAPMGIAVPGIFSIGGPVTTASGLVFIAATLENVIRAFDTASGKELWRAELPAGGQATPMTYVSGKSGRQYVLIAAGGHGALGSTPGDNLIAFRLPTYEQP